MMPDDGSSNGVHPPGLRHKRNVGWHVLRANIAGGENNSQIRPQTLRGLGQFRATHAGHAHIRKQNLDLGISSEKLEGLMAVVGVKHRTAEVFHDADRSGADLGHGPPPENAYPAPEPRSPS